jgi:hypothetical protein
MFLQEDDANDDREHRARLAQSRDISHGRQNDLYVSYIGFGISKRKKLAVSDLVAL